MFAHVAVWGRRVLTSPLCLLQAVRVPGPDTAIGALPRARDAPRGGGPNGPHPR